MKKRVRGRRRAAPASCLYQCEQCGVQEQIPAEILEFFEIAIPGKYVPMPSNLCWGGADRRTAYITCGGSDMLVKVHGKGTYVAADTPHRLQTVKYAGFLEDLQERVLKLTVTDVEMQQVAAAPDIAALLGVASGTELTRIRRLRHIDNQATDKADAHRLGLGVLSLSWGNKETTESQGQDQQGPAERDRGGRRAAPPGLGGLGGRRARIVRKRNHAKLLPVNCKRPVAAEG